MLDSIFDNFEYGFETYKDFLFGLFVGLFVAWIYHRFIGTYNLRQSYNVLLRGKDETIQDNKALILDKCQLKTKIFLRNSNDCSEVAKSTAFNHWTMTYIILTAIFLVWVCSLINSYIDNHRQIAFNKMNLIYD